MHHSMAHHDAIFDVRIIRHKAFAVTDQFDTEIIL